MSHHKTKKFKKNLNLQKYFKIEDVPPNLKTQEQLREMGLYKGGDAVAVLLVGGDQKQYFYDFGTAVAYVSYYQTVFGRAVSSRALKRLKLGDVAPDPNVQADSDFYSWLVRGRPELGDMHNSYVVRIKKGLSNPSQLKDPANASCTCALDVFPTPRKYNQCSHILACEFYRLSQKLPKGKELTISRNRDLGEYDVSFEVDNNSGAIFLKKFSFNDRGPRWEKERFLGLGGKDAWKDYFSYRDGVFYLKIKNWNNLIKAVEFADHGTVEVYHKVVDTLKVFFDAEFFITYFNYKPDAVENVEKVDQKKKEELAKNVEITAEGDRLIYSFHEGFEKYCPSREIEALKEWGYIQKYKNKVGFIDEFFKKIKPVRFEKEKTESNRNNITFFSTSIGFSTLFSRFLQEKGFIISQPAPSMESHQFTLKPDTEPRDYQREAVDAWNNAGNVGLIVSPGASGKTLIGTMAIAAKGVKTLILVHTNDLIEQWKESLLQFRT